MSSPGHRIMAPDRLTSSAIFASPHSGREYSWSFLRRSALGELVIRSSEDAYVDQLIQSAPQHGTPLIVATVPRAYVDLNRSAEELDPALIEGVKKTTHNPRVASGLGVIPRVVANGRTIYRGKLSLVEAQSRLTDYWHPYHAALSRLLDQAHANFDQAILVDFHSMPREALESAALQYTKRPEIVLGDRFGASASGAIVDEIESYFVQAGFHVLRNTPFAGAYITQTYGRPSRRQHVVQVEIDRSLYMHETSLVPNQQFLAVRDALGQVIQKIAELGRIEGLPLAAE